MLKLKLSFIFIIQCLFIINIYAVKQIDRHASSEIIINSDNLTYEKGNNVASFDGNVILWFNNMVLKTTNIKIFYTQINKQNRIDKIVIPNKLSALKNQNSDILIAEKGIYFFDKGELWLNGNVILQHGDNILKTDSLVLVAELKKIADQ